MKNPAVSISAETSGGQSKRKPQYLIEVKLRDVQQLFNSMDPSPFNEKDLDHDAEEFIVSWALEHPSHASFKLVVHLSQLPAGNAQAMIEDAVHHYFDYKAELNWREFKILMKEGRLSLLIGVTFMAACVSIADVFGRSGGGAWLQIFREGLTVGGWVAMWRPLEIYLYRWWPLRRLGRIYRKLSEMEVEVRQTAAPGFPI
ncbi:MAG: hypothetical protein JWM16_3509 [Verrucomicrobiales bacterium]|nr:hypothetical protein [Verrucomicrobiales bacterium]